MHNKMTWDPTVANRYGFVNKTLKPDIHDEVYNVVPSSGGWDGEIFQSIQYDFSFGIITKQYLKNLRSDFKARDYETQHNPT